MPILDDKKWWSSGGYKFDGCPPEIGSVRCDFHGIHIIHRGEKCTLTHPQFVIAKYGWTIKLTIFQRLQHIKLYEPVCFFVESMFFHKSRRLLFAGLKPFRIDRIDLPNEVWWGIWNLTPRVQGRRPAAVREIEHFTTSQCLEGAGIQWFPPVTDTNANRSPDTCISNHWMVLEGNSAGNHRALEYWGFPVGFPWNIYWIFSIFNPFWEPSCLCLCHACHRIGCRALALALM